MKLLINKKITIGVLIILLLITLMLLLCSSPKEKINNTQSRSTISAVVVEQAVVIPDDNAYDTQKIAVVWEDNIDKLREVRLVYKNADGTNKLISESDRTDRSILFEKQFSNDEECEYNLVSIEYNQEGVEKKQNINLSDLQIKAGFSVSSELTDKNKTVDAGIATIESTNPDEISNNVRSLLSAASVPNGALTNSNDRLVVTLDPGHSTNDPGARHNGLIERDLNWAIAVACKEELEEYGVEVHLTRTQYGAADPDPYGTAAAELHARVQIAESANSDLLVSLHNNAGGGEGFEIYYPYDTSFNKDAHMIGYAVSKEIENELSKLGIGDRGLRTRLIDGHYDGYDYPGGAVGDYYAIIRYSREVGIPAVLVEHAYMDNGYDAGLLSDPAFLKALGVADATGIANYYGLTKTVITGITIDKTNVILKEGEETQLNAKLEPDETIAYKRIKWNSSNTNIVTVSNEGNLKAVGVGEATVTANIGSVTASCNVVVDGAENSKIEYMSHVSSIGWLSYVADGELSGTDEKNQQIEAVQIRKGHGLDNNSGSIEYRTNIQSIGWENSWKKDGEMSGTSGQALRLEAIQIRLTGDLAEKYDVYYRVHAQSIGWMGWAKNGESAGTAGYAYRLEGIEIKLVEKGSAAPGSMSNHYRDANNGNGKISYTTHVQSIGWQNYVSDGEMAGTSGQALRLEGIYIKKGLEAIEAGYTGSIEYRTHIQSIGWENSWKKDGEMSGTSGQALRLEAIQIRLTGDLAEKYDVYYRVHAQSIGWMGWAKNGESAGTAGYAYRLEGINIVLVDKGNQPPAISPASATNQPFVEKAAVVDQKTPICGSSQVTVQNMVNYYNKTDNTYPAYYSSSDAPTLEDFCRIYIDEAAAEGVRAEVAFCQAMKETGWLKYGGQVKINQYNFAGIGATDNGGGKTIAEFPNVRTGIRAQIQHLKAYASTAGLNNTCVDPRFNLVTRGCAPYVEDLSGKWSTGSNYGETIVVMINNLLNS